MAHTIHSQARKETRRWASGLRAGFSLGSPAQAPSPAPPAPRPPWRVGALLALAVFALYALTSAGTLSSRDGGVMYDTTLALLNRHTLRLPPHHHGLPGVGGGFYSKYGLGQSLAEIPLYVLGQGVAAWVAPPLAARLALAITMLTNPLLMALAVWLFYALAYELRPDVRGAVAAALLVAMSTPYWPYAKTDFSEPLSALSLTGAALFLVRARAQPGVRYRYFVLAGLFLSLALLAKLTAALALPALGLYAAYVAAEVAARDRAMAVRPQVARGLAAWGAAVAAGFALDGLYNLARFGRITDSGYYAEDLPFHAPLWRGLEGLLVSPGKGLLWYCPLVLVALALWPTLLARRRAEGVLALGIVLPTVAVLATYPVWWGGICWGPRYLVPLLPFMMMPLAFLLERLPRALRTRRALMGVVALSVLVQVLGVAVHPERYLRTGIQDAQYLWRPSYSPLLAHAWLAAYDVVGMVDHADAPAMLAGYPWRHAHGTSPTQRLVIRGWSYWWWVVLEGYGLRQRAALVVAAALLLLMALALWGLRRLRHAAPLSPYDHAHMAVRM